ncbi:DNA cytosine methyltransferase [Actinokineospora iranica]|uniref:DNA cytosine methyltransferase n=1 Tax=Actinokineospora iranica TaxID=1271860 RepID=UPI001E3058F7|nr:DNA (cytosine-5-)-methyltransferase [Actinokineospora iranica]
MPKLAAVREQTALPLEPMAVEFFAGIGLARLGLQQAGFRVAWSNDIEPAKRDMYAGNFKDPEESHTFVLGDVTHVRGSDMPADIALAWASSPCVDVSLAGARAGMQGARSSTFYQFTRVLRELGEDARPEVVTLENVVGLATSHGGEDLAAAIAELNDLGYSVDVLTLDARWFVPQSRPRLFVVGARNAPPDQPDANPKLRPEWLQAPFADRSLVTHRALLPDIGPAAVGTLATIVEPVPSGDKQWWDPERTAAFTSSLSPVQAERLAVLRKSNRFAYRTAYRRTRKGVPMWEIRADDIAGCLRTARGGSSKQALVEVGRGKLRVRWMTAREYARLMGADDYELDGIRANQALFGFGDAVCVPAVAWLAEHYLMPLVEGKLQEKPVLDSTSEVADAGA